MTYLNLINDKCIAVSLVLRIVVFKCSWVIFLYYYFCKSYITIICNYICVDYCIIWCIFILCNGLYNLNRCTIYRNICCCIVGYAFCCISSYCRFVYLIGYIFICYYCREGKCIAFSYIKCRDNKRIVSCIIRNIECTVNAFCYNYICKRHISLISNCICPYYSFAYLICSAIYRFCNFNCRIIYKSKICICIGYLFTGFCYTIFTCSCCNCTCNLTINNSLVICRYYILVCITLTRFKNCYHDIVIHNYCTVCKYKFTIQIFSYYNVCKSCITVILYNICKDYIVTLKVFTIINKLSYIYRIVNNINYRTVVIFCSFFGNSCYKICHLIIR